MKVSLLLFVLCFAIIPINLMSGDLGTAKYAGEFLELGVGARSLGMGGAYVAVARDVTAGYWNPAGLAFLKHPQVMLMYSQQFDNVVGYNYGSIGMPLGRRTSLGLSVIRVGVDGIFQTALPRPDLDIDAEYVDENGQTQRNRPVKVGEFGSADYAFLLTYSRAISDGFAYGGNVKIIHRSLGDNSAWGVGFDLGFLFNPVSQLILGFNLQNVTSTMVAWDTGRKELITPSLRAGFTYPIKFSSLGGQVQPAVDLIFRFENRQESALTHIGATSVDINIGWEYLYQDAFALRLGSSEVGNFTAGVGLHLPKLHVDYAFLGHEDLGSTHRISAKLTFFNP